jgi:hypothetical protein
MPDLYRAHFTGRKPAVRVHDGTVTIRYHRGLFLDWLGAPREPLAAIALSGSLPWELEFHGGVSRLTADLRGLRLLSVDLLGGASHVTMSLPRPVGTVFIHIAGGVSDIILQRPVGVAVRALISGSSSDLRLDDRYIGASPRSVRWQTPDYERAGGRYDISIAGSASRLAIVTQEAL